jgi:hypothetical protein
MRIFHNVPRIFVDRQDPVSKAKSCDFNIMRLLTSVEIDSISISQDRRFQLKNPK